MNCLKENRLNHEAGLRRIIAVFFAAIILIAGTVPAGSQTAQATFNIDLGAAVNPANITVLGASANDHLSGNGTANTFSTFPRTHAIAVGDLNHDGFQDVVIGAPDTDFTPTGGTLRGNAGAVYVVFGKASFAANTVIDPAAAAPANQPDIRIFGANADDAAGFAVATGDVNGDGNDDLILGAPGFDSSTGSPAVPHPNAGAVYIIFGGTTLTPQAIDLATANAADILITGEADNDHFGSALAVGDVNGGLVTTADLLVGAPNSAGPTPATPRVNGGAVFLFQGGTGLANATAITRLIDLAVAPSPATVRVYGRVGSLFGSAVAIADVNSEIAPDIIVGAPKAARPDQGGDVAETGSVNVLFGGANIAPPAPATTLTIDLAAGNLATLRLAIYGASANDHLGASVAAGNLRGNGVTDLVMGAPDADGPGDGRADAGETYVLAGGTVLNPSVGTTERRIDVSLGTMNLTVYGAAVGDHLGTTVAVGRINTQSNTDTIADLLIGAPATSSSKGAVHVLYGGQNLFFLATRDLSLGQNDLTVTGQANGDELGWAIAAGDLDNNTGGDLVLGAPFADFTARVDSGKVYVLLATQGNLPPVNQNPVVTVTKPNGGESAFGGVPFNIDWMATDANGDQTIDHFDIFLSTDSGTTFNIKVNGGPVAGNLRTFAWDVPHGLTTTTARIRVIAFDTAGGTGQDDSNNNFSITDAGIGVTLTAPNGGEQLKPGNVFNITWTVPPALAAQVRGFDLFLSTDGINFNIPITPVNPTQPALAADIRTFPWTVGAFCTTNARVLVRATSITGAVSTDASDGLFSIANAGPTVNLTDGSFFSASFVLILTTTTINGQEVLFQPGVMIEISNDEAGTTFFSPTKIGVKPSGRKLKIKGSINGMEIGTFWPDGATRIIRITNPSCGLTLLRAKRVGSTVVAAPAFDGLATPSIQ